MQHQDKMLTGTPLTEVLHEPWLCYDAQQYLTDRQMALQACMQFPNNSSRYGIPLPLNQLVIVIKML